MSPRSGEAILFRARARCASHARTTCVAPPKNLERAAARLSHAQPFRSRAEGERTRGCLELHAQTTVLRMGDLGSTRYLPIAYLPGASGRALSWEPIAAVLSYRREPHLFDYPGLGEHAPVPGIADLDDLTRWIAGQLPAVCDIVTLSMGSALGLRLALDYPERVRRLVLVTPCGGFDAQRFSALDWREVFVEQRPEAPRWFVDDTRDLTAQLGSVSAATLVVMGDEDPIAPPAIGELLLQRLPAAKLEIVQNAGHDLEEEHPAFLASLIEAHLRR